MRLPLLCGTYADKKNVARHAFGAVRVGGNEVAVTTYILYMFDLNNFDLDNIE
ncbi:hypothetical protein NPX98_05520 [Bartonella sp. A5(2022)]|nr:hypothetical protein [Bartonella sp. A05]